MVPPDLGSQTRASSNRRSRVREILTVDKARARPCPRVSQPPLVVATVTGSQFWANHEPERAGGQFPPRPQLGEALGRRRVTPRRTCPQPIGLGRNLRSKTRWFTGFCNSHQVSHFATFFIDARAEISVAESHFFAHCERRRPPRPVPRANGARSLFSWSLARPAPGFCSCTEGRDHTRPLPTAGRGRVLLPPACDGKLVRESFCGAGSDNDPSAGSPTETLLRLLLPLNDKVQWTSRDVAGGEPPTSPRSEHFTGPFNR